MKKFYTLFSSLFLLAAVNAQTTIVELDGANNDFDPSDWTISNDPGFSSSSSIIISAGETGAYTFMNSTLYSDINVEVHFSQGGATPITFESSMFDGAVTANAPGGTIYSDANTPKVAVYAFNNATGFAISTITFTSLSMSGTIVYLKITGKEESGNSSSLVDFSAEDLKIFSSDKVLYISSLIEGSVKLYGVNGALVDEFEVQTGDNSKNFHALNGMYIVTVQDKKGNFLRKEKVLF